MGPQDSDEKDKETAIAVIEEQDNASHATASIKEI
jgi:hypothetical protein